MLAELLDKTKAIQDKMFDDLNSLHKLILLNLDDELDSEDDEKMD